MAENPFQTLKLNSRLPTPPGVAMRILQLVESDETSLEDLTQVIGSDPALTSKILKFISSPLVGLGFSGTTVAEAVARIGMRGTQMMALSFSLVSEKHRESCPSFSFERFWSESLARAVAARCLARHLCGWDPEEAFITGLLARIGRLVLAAGMPDEYEPVLAGTSQAGFSLEERERAALGADHLEVGMQLLREWSLPEIVWKTAALLGPGRERINRSAVVIEVADVIAAFLVDDARHTAAGIRELAALAWERLEIEAEPFSTLLGQIGQDWINYGRLLSVQTQKPPDIAAIESQADDHRNALRLAAELDVQTLRSENEHLGRLALRDRLTGLLNRAAFDEAFAIALAAARDHLEPLALLFIDADHFKMVNDEHGHRTGDAVLEHLARVLDDNVRKRDQVFRYGGEEFAVLAPLCSRESAAALAEDIRGAVERTPHTDGERSLRVTVSIGVACAQWPERPFTEADMVEYADRRLYDAKRAGRNTWKIVPSAGAGFGWWRRLGRMFSGAPVRQCGSR